MLSSQTVLDKLLRPTLILSGEKRNVFRHSFRLPGPAGADWPPDSNGRQPAPRKCAWRLREGMVMAAGPRRKISSQQALMTAREARQQVK